MGLSCSGSERDILHVHVPAFAVAVARLGEPTLRRRPVAVAMPGARSALLAVSAEARREGISRGMSVVWAQRCCPGLRVVPPQPEATARLGGALAETAARHTPLWESSRPGHLFVDLHGSSRLLGPPRDVAMRLEAEIRRRLGLPASLGVGSSKLVSCVASHYLIGGGVCDVLRGTEPGFLAPLPLDLLPGLGTARRRVLADWGVVRIGELAALPRDHVVAVFGARGEILHRRAAGEDWEPVRSSVVQPTVEEELALPRDSAEPEELLFHLRSLAERGCSRLRSDGWVAGRLEVRVRYADGRTARRAGRLVPPTSWDHEVFPVARQSFVATWVRRVRVRGLGIGLLRLSSGALQLGLFQHLSGESRREVLCRTLDAVRRRYGPDAVTWGALPGTGKT